MARASRAVEFGASIKHAFVGYFDFSGKTSRREYFHFVIFSWIIAAGFNQLFVFLILPLFAITVRRLNDVGKSWVWLFSGPFLLFVIFREGLATSAGTLPTTGAAVVKAAVVKAAVVKAAVVKAAVVKAPVVKAAVVKAPAVKAPAKAMDPPRIDGLLAYLKAKGISASLEFKELGKRRENYRISVPAGVELAVLQNISNELAASMSASEVAISGVGSTHEGKQHIFILEIPAVRVGGRLRKSPDLVESEEKKIPIGDVAKEPKEKPSKTKRAAEADFSPARLRELATELDLGFLGDEDLILVGNAVLRKVWESLSRAQLPIDPATRQHVVLISRAMGASAFGERDADSASLKVGRAKALMWHGIVLGLLCDRNGVVDAYMSASSHAADGKPIEALRLAMDWFVDSGETKLAGRAGEELGQLGRLIEDRSVQEEGFNRSIDLFEKIGEVPRKKQCETNAGPNFLRTASPFFDGGAATLKSTTILGSYQAEKIRLYLCIDS